MKILAVDQARHGGWAVYEYEEKSLIAYGTFAFEDKEYTYPQAILKIEELIDSVIRAYEIDAVFLEDVQLRQNTLVFKRLAQLQGVLINLCEKNDYRYGIVVP